MSSDLIPVVTDPHHPGLPLLEAVMATINQGDQPHNVVLDVLFSLYSTVVLRSPCCQDAAEEVLSRLQDKLRKARTLRHYSAEAAQAAIERAAHGRHPPH